MNTAIASPIDPPPAEYELRVQRSLPLWKWTYRPASGEHERAGEQLVGTFACRCRGPVWSNVESKPKPTAGGSRERVRRPASRPTRSWRGWAWAAWARFIAPAIPARADGRDQDPAAPARRERRVHQRFRARPGQPLRSRIRTSRTSTTLASRTASISSRWIALRGRHGQPDIDRICHAGAGADYGPDRKRRRRSRGSSRGAGRRTGATLRDGERPQAIVRSCSGTPTRLPSPRRRRARPGSCRRARRGRAGRRYLRRAGADAWLASTRVSIESVAALPVPEPHRQPRARVPQHRPHRVPDQQPRASPGLKVTSRTRRSSPRTPSRTSPRSPARSASRPAPRPPRAAGQAAVARRS